MILAEDERCGNILLISLSRVAHIRAHILLSTYARRSNREYDPRNKSAYVQSYKWLKDRKCNMFPLSAKMYAVPNIRQQVVYFTSPCRDFIRIRIFSRKNRVARTRINTSREKCIK